MQKELGKRLDKLIEKFRKQWVELNKMAVICFECDERWIPGHLCDSKFDKDKVSKMPKEHQQAVERDQDESTHENMLKDPNSSTLVHEHGQGRTS